MKNEITSARRPIFRPRHLLLALSCLLWWGCPGKPPAPQGGPTAPSAGKVVIRGSNTIGEELAPRLIAEFRRQHPEIEFDLESKATGYGMAALRVGKCDLAAASRAAIAADVELAKQAGLEMSEYVIGAYSVAVVVHANNPVTNLTKQQVREIFTGKIKNWKEVGGPDAEIRLCLRDPISGTYLGFKEIAMDNEEYAMSAALFTDYPALVGAVAADPAAIGFAGFAMTRAPGVKAVDIDGVPAQDATVHAGKYPYARAVRFYTNKQKESEATRAFLSYVLSAEGQELVRLMGFSGRP
jgi:phosphate transport system substrate-binding protein